MRLRKLGEVVLGKDCFIEACLGDKLESAGKTRGMSAFSVYIGVAEMHLDEEDVCRIQTGA